MNKIKIFDKQSNTNVLIAGIFCLMITMGLARFSYTSLLPSMLEHSLSLTLAGILTSVNYIGYLTGAILLIFIKNQNTKVNLFRLGIFLCISSTLFMGVKENETVWIIARFIAGFAAAIGFIIGSFIVTTKLNAEDKIKAMGLYFSGVGISIVVSDLIARWGLYYYSWEASWIILSALGMLIMAYPLYILSFDEQTNTKNDKSINKETIFTPFIVLLIIVYFTQGVGFVVLTTFFPMIIQTLDGLESIANLVWIIGGFAAIPSTIIWMRLASKYGSVNMIICASLIQLFGIIIPTITMNPLINILAAIFFGGTIPGIVALFLNLAGNLVKENAVLLISILTIAYGLGQIIAPIYTVALTSLSGNYDLALYLTAGIVLVGILLMYTSKRVMKVVY